MQNIAKDAIMNTSKADYAISLICSMTDEEIRKGLEIFEAAYAEYSLEKGA